MCQTDCFPYGFFPFKINHLCDLHYIQNSASVIRFDCAALVPELQNSDLATSGKLGVALLSGQDIVLTVWARPVAHLNMRRAFLCP